MSESAETVRRLTSRLGSQSGVAELLDVDRSSISRWLRKTDTPDAENKAKLDALDFVYKRLLQTLEADTARKWLTGANAHLGNRRPIDLLIRNRVAEVVAAIEETATGSYA